MLRMAEHVHKYFLKQEVLFCHFLSDLLLHALLCSALFLPYRAALSISQMNKMNMRATDTRIRILKELAIVELDKQGNVKLVV